MAWRGDLDLGGEVRCEKSITNLPRVIRSNSLQVGSAIGK